ncbi:MAG: caspase family protein [Deltaproteobacteria bacterium]|nr:caspase family protein [Deltaproteobacteria bacterium]
MCCARSLVVGAALLVATAASAESTTRTYGLVVGFNQTDDPNNAPLRYADDDAVKNAQLLADLGADYVLLADLDAETRRLYPDVVAAAPSKAALFAAVDALNDRIHEHPGQGSQLFIFYSGHGDVQNGEGFIQVRDGRLRRSELRELIARARADSVHLIVDACKSYFLVFARGATGLRRPLSGQLVHDDSQPLPEHVGIILSASAAQDSHEWEAFAGGVFSHEVRSAMRGAADLDADGVISYAEAAAFIYTANEGIANARFRPQFFMRAPHVREEAALVDTRSASVSRLRALPAPPRHWYLEDQQGNRIADFHPGPGQRLALILPPTRPLFLREPRKRTEYRIQGVEPWITVGDLAAPQNKVQRRGAEHEAFTRLFQTPFAAGALTSYRRYEAEARLEDVLAPGAGSLRPALGIGGLIAVSAGTLVWGAGAVERAGIDEHTSNEERTRFNERVAGYRWTSAALWAAGAASLLAYALWTWAPANDTQIEIISAGKDYTGVRWSF